MPQRPNVIVFFTDQQRHDSTGIHGNPLGLTPNFDRLAQQHTHVRHSFTCQPVCGPARSCLQTGQYATTTGVWKNGIAMKNDAVTLAKQFNTAGYHTGYIGKWHLAKDTDGPVKPDDRGGYQYWLAANCLEHTSDTYDTVVYDNDQQPVKLPGYRVDALTDAAIRYVDAHKAEPFFLFISHLEPHHQNHVDDYPPPDGYRQQYAGRWVPPDLAALPAFAAVQEEHAKAQQLLLGGTTHQQLGGYWGMVKRLDEAFGRLMDALKSLGLAENTIVLFTSDHACHFKTRNSEYKRSCHESSIRVPTLLAGPGFEGGGSLPQLVSLVDMPPTLLDAAGLDVPYTMQGRSVMPLVRRQNMDWPEEVFVQISEAECGRAVRTKRWKYAVRAEGVSGNKQGGAESYTETYLYDLQHDEHELRNLVNEESHKVVRAVMRQRLLRRMKEAGEPEPTIIEAPTHRSGQRIVTEAETLQ